MKVYTVIFESNIYQSLVAEDLTVWRTDKLRFDGSPKSGNWTTPGFRILNPKLAKGDFFGIGPGALGVTAKTVDSLLSFFERAGELLAIKPKELGVSCLNVTECFDCLDHDRVSWVYGQESGKPIRIDKFAFKKDLIPESSLFKIPEIAKAEILTHTGMLDSEDDFKTNVERMGLKGLRFKMIWSDEGVTGPGLAK